MISRRGAAADHGQSHIEFSSPSFSWSKSESCVKISQARVSDFSTNAHHSYTVRITPGEVNEILRILAEAALKEPAAMEKHLAPSLKALVQLQHVAGVRT